MILLVYSNESNGDQHDQINSYGANRERGRSLWGLYSVSTIVYTSLFTKLVSLGHGFCIQKYVLFFTRCVCRGNHTKKLIIRGGGLKSRPLKNVFFSPGPSPNSTPCFCVFTLLPHVHCFHCYRFRVQHSALSGKS